MFDFFVHLRAGKSRGHANGILHGVGVRTPMADHANAAHAQQRRAAVFRVINRLLDPLESASRKQIAQLRNHRNYCIDLRSNSKICNASAFANLQRDVADKAVADDHIHVARKQIPAFHIPHKMHRQSSSDGHKPRASIHCP